MSSPTTLDRFHGTTHKGSYEVRTMDPSTSNMEKKLIWIVDGNVKEDYLKLWIKHKHECQTSLINQQVEEG